MRAIQVRRYGGPEELVAWELGTPKPDAGEALVRISHAGVNFTDIYTRQGLYRHSTTYRNQPPFVPGMEATGVVEVVGDVERVQSSFVRGYAEMPVQVHPW